MPKRKAVADRVDDLQVKTSMSYFGGYRMLMRTLPALDGPEFLRTRPRFDYNRTDPST